MKKIYLILFIVLVAMQLKAQLEYNKYGDIVPFSQVERYMKKIDSHKVKTYFMPDFNNDSLCRVHNKGKSIYEFDGNGIGGINLYNEPIDLKKEGTKIKLKEGTLWRYCIEGNLVKKIGIVFKFERLEEGTYLALIAKDESRFIQPPKIYTQATLPENFPRNHRLSGSVIGNKVILEYFEPKNIKVEFPIIINDILYGFVGIGPERTSIDDPTKLKSGFRGNSEFVSCQKDVTCAEVSTWKDEAKSVVFIRIKAKINGESEYFNGSGFFE